MRTEKNLDIFFLYEPHEPLPYIISSFCVLNFLLRWHLQALCCPCFFISYFFYLFLLIMNIFIYIILLAESCTFPQCGINKGILFQLIPPSSSFLSFCCSRSFFHSSSLVLLFFSSLIYVPPFRTLVLHSLFSSPLLSPPPPLPHFVSGLSAIQDILSLTSTEEEASWGRKQFQRCWTVWWWVDEVEKGRRERCRGRVAGWSRRGEGVRGQDVNKETEWHGRRQSELEVSGFSSVTDWLSTSRHWSVCGINQSDSDTYKKTSHKPLRWVYSFIFLTFNPSEY